MPKTNRKCSFFESPPGMFTVNFPSLQQLKKKSFKNTVNIGGGLLLLLPTALIRMIETYMGPEPLPPKPELAVVPEWNSDGLYGMLPVQASFPLFA